MCSYVEHGNKGSFLDGVSRTTAFTDLTVGFSDLPKKLNLFLGESFEDKPFSYYPERLCTAPPYIKLKTFVNYVIKTNDICIKNDAYCFEHACASFSQNSPMGKY